MNKLISCWLYKLLAADDNNIIEPAAFQNSELDLNFVFQSESLFQSYTVEKNTSTCYRTAPWGKTLPS